MSAAGTGGFAVVADGISEALVTTAAGIFVAVEAVVLYNFFQARLGRASTELKLMAEEFVELLGELPPAPPQSPPIESESAAAGV
jgi:biopolymer transport protein ExbB